MIPFLKKKGIRYTFSNFPYLYLTVSMNFWHLRTLFFLLISRLNPGCRIL